MRQYKVVEVKKEGFFGTSRLDGDRLEKILNEQAQSGWIFDKHVSGETLILDKDTIMLIFYKEK
ncbi:hypothetical protein SDC9_15113 [bioreactor metagenome]|uniref:DUF4177 domain-containing protein n=1 Tax=bioreactor metagenome TaxID=1076179 RepID=A0A644TR05_9ZZZZ|nr:DUF4177 domain-containing protein [Negativicutes bacterium]